MGNYYHRALFFTLSDYNVLINCEVSSKVILLFELGVNTMFCQNLTVSVELIKIHSLAFTPLR